MEEQKSLLSPRDNSQECLCDDWSDDSSCSSYCSDSDSSVPEWEPSINSDGELFYIDWHPFAARNSEPELPVDEPLSKNKTRHSTRGKFLKLLRRRDSKRRSKRLSKITESASKVTFQDHNEGEIREVTIKVEQENRFKLGRRGTLIESFLGLTVSTFSDGNRLMIAGFSPDSEAAKSVKIGEWLKSINGIEVTYQSLNVVLEQLSNESEVSLKLQRVAGVEITNPSNLIQRLANFKGDDKELCKEFVGVVYIDTEGVSETGPEYEGVLYCYPQPYDKNVLCKSRGIFITLNQLLYDTTKSKPQVSSLMLNNRLLHIVYNAWGNRLLLFMLPDSHLSQSEAVLTCNEIIRTLEFTYQNIANCFTTEKLKSQIDDYFKKCFTKILNTLQTEKLDITSKFEEVLPAACFLPLPNEANMQIDDALSELEASDYREWNEDPLDCQRLFTILGSALYHAGCLLASHFVYGDLIDVHSYCRQQGLLHLFKNEPVRSLVLWKEVFPFSCNRSMDNANSLFKVPEGRRYLLIAGSGKDMLAVIMEAGGCTEPPEDNMGPDAFYVEEVQATLSHLQALGIPDLADRWISTNPGIQVTIPEAPIKRKNDFLGTFTKSSSPNLTKDSSPIQAKKHEITSILKRRNSEHNLLPTSGSAFSLIDDTYEAHSEDSASQRSEISDEPILGRRAVREKKTFDSDDEESDIEDYRDGSQISSSSYDLSELRQTLLSETEDNQPIQLTAGVENILFHYVQLDATEGILLCPPECNIKSSSLDFILKNFRKCCLEIHNLFQNTLRFNMLAQDMAKSVINKSLIAIKEHGILFEFPFQDELSKKPFIVNYWVIGRLFYVPHPREVYVCYQDIVPQNLVEVAFRLGTTLAA